MIVFGTSLSDAEAYRRYAAPGIRRSAEPDSEVLALAASGPTGRCLNLVLDAAASRTDLEALVLVQQDVEIVDPDFCLKVRQCVSDSEVGAVGCVGATGVRSIAWWEGSVSAAPIVQRYHEHGGGELPAFSWAQVDRPPADVETLNGFLLVVSPWVVRNIRFDESLVLGHGYDLDFCLQIREAGRRLRTADFRVIYHHTLELVSDVEIWIEAHIKAAEKLNGRIPGVEPFADDWKARARRAEGEREAALTIAYSSASRLEAQIEPLERAVDEMTHSVSWRVTEPLRWANRRRAALLERRRSRGN